MLQGDEDIEMGFNEIELMSGLQKTHVPDRLWTVDFIDLKLDLNSKVFP
jgi:hypothetical protein